MTIIVFDPREYGGGAAGRQGESVSKRLPVHA